MGERSRAACGGLAGAGAGVAVDCFFGGGAGEAGAVTGGDDGRQVESGFSKGPGGLGDGLDVNKGIAQTALSRSGSCLRAVIERCSGVGVPEPRRCGGVRRDERQARR